MIVDGVLQSQSLFDMVMQTQKFSNDNNVIKFSDNSRFEAISKLSNGMRTGTISFKWNSWMED